MKTVTIPRWDSRQVLPPNDASDPVSAQRSPYNASLLDLIDRFAISLARCEVLDGYLKFRASLHSAGVVAGFQWLDGSFLENIEILEGRAPNDVDVVTFLADPAAANLVPPDLLDHPVVKHTFHVDSYWLELYAVDPVYLVDMTAYWYSMWSHRRNSTWKGFVSVDLHPHEDGAATAALAQRRIDLFPPAPNLGGI